MKIVFLGATHEVTGSCTYVEAAGKKFIVDCGMEQGRDTFLNQTIPVDAGQIDFVLLTHAHIDHSGNLPLLVKNGFSGPIYATDVTCKLSRIMLADCAHIQESEAEYQNRKGKRAGRDQIEPIYTLDDAMQAVSQMKPCSYGQKVSPAEGIEIRFTDIGHLLGSACIEVWMTENGKTRKMVFSGDIGNVNQPIIRDPSTVEDADYLLIESTYGNRLHEQNDGDHVTALAEMIQRTLDRGGNVVIPSFAVGRTQEMLYFIREIKNRGLVKGHDGFRVVVDSPLAAEATKIFQGCDVSYLDEEAAELIEKGINPLVFDGLELSETVEDSKALNKDPEPKVIISASGMCTAGRIRHHLKHNLWRPECLIAFVGYQAEGTLGRMLYDGADMVRLFGEEIAVRAEIALLPGMSGHADRDGLVKWAKGFKKPPIQTFVNHGDDESCTQFAETLKTECGFDAMAPHSGTEYDLAAGEFIKLTDGAPIKKEAASEEPAAKKREAGSDAYREFLEALEKLNTAARKNSGTANRILRNCTSSINKILKDLQ
ncbi:MAG: MBL fold metallo-hydrolase RNA specificity domain-containing protein [Oscillospiraceae bacterium]|jgi:metallo-beta-lactamase family protein